MLSVITVFRDMSQPAPDSLAAPGRSGRRSGRRTGKRTLTVKEEEKKNNVSIRIQILTSSALANFSS